MKTFSSTILVATAALAIISLVSGPAYAAPTPLQDPAPTHSQDASSNVPYALILSLPDSTSYLSHTSSVILKLANPTQYTLAMRWTGPEVITFNVEYASVTSGLGHQIDWKQLTPNVQPPSDNSHSNFGFNVVSGSVQRIRIASEESETFPPVIPNFPVLKPGFYRISAVLTVPDASEYNGAISPAAKVRSFRLVVRSKPLIIRRTATGFVEVPASTDKQALPK